MKLTWNFKPSKRKFKNKKWLTIEWIRCWHRTLIICIWCYKTFSQESKMMQRSSRLQIFTVTSKVKRCNQVDLNPLFRYSSQHSKLYYQKSNRKVDRRSNWFIRALRRSVEKIREEAGNRRSWSNPSLWMMHRKTKVLLFHSRKCFSLMRANIPPTTNNSSTMIPIYSSKEHSSHIKNKRHSFRRISSRLFKILRITILWIYRIFHQPCLPR